MSDYYDRQGRLTTYEALRPAFDAAKAEGGDYRFVAKTTVPEADAEVSTVWLGLDHAYGGGPPLIFETMVFGGGLDQDQQRYSTETEARAGHDQMVAKVKQEAAAFRELVSEGQVVAAVSLIEERLGAHLKRFDIYDYDGRAYTRAVKAINP